MALCLGGSKIAPLPGFWRYDEFTENIIECKNTESCAGGYSNNVYTPTGICNTPYKGNVCSNCDVMYGKFGSSARCSNCHDNPIYYVKFAGFFLIQIITIIYTIICNILEKDKSMNQRRKNLKTDGTVKAAFHSILIKIIINYVQMSSLIVGIGIDWPTVISDLFSVLTNVFPSQKDGFSVECFLALNMTNAEDIYYVRYFVTLVLPVFIWLLMAGIYAVKLKSHGERLRKNKTFKKNLAVFSVVIGFVSQPNIVKPSLEFFNCINLRDPSNPLTFMEDHP